MCVITTAHSRGVEHNQSIFFRRRGTFVPRQTQKYRIFFHTDTDTQHTHRILKGASTVQSDFDIGIPIRLPKIQNRRSFEWVSKKRIVVKQFVCYNNV
jgi:hypothetical protein